MTDTAITPARDTSETIGELVRRATASGASEAERRRVFGRIVVRFQDMAYGCAYAILGDRHLAEDAAQESFLTAWREIENLREADAFNRMRKTSMDNRKSMREVAEAILLTYEVQSGATR